jgi:hypothetical protein
MVDILEQSATLYQDLQLDKGKYGNSPLTYEVVETEHW